MKHELGLRECIRAPIPEIGEAARLLSEAVSAHLKGNSVQAETLIAKSDMPIIRDWTESIWGTHSPFISVRSLPNALPTLKKSDRIKIRMPSAHEKQALRNRDGFHCRFCGVHLIRKEVRQALKLLYPNAVLWGRKNIEQHAALQAMWLQYDHVLPHSHGGGNDVENIVITCAPCNFGRMDHLIEEIGLIDPRLRKPEVSNWNGLEQLIT